MSLIYFHLLPEAKEFYLRQKLCAIASKAAYPTGRSLSWCDASLIAAAEPAAGGVLYGGCRQQLACDVTARQDAKSAESTALKTPRRVITAGERRVA